MTCQPPVPASESLTSSSVLRFENMADWSSSAGAIASESAAVAEGARALRLGAVPWTRLESRLFATSELSAVSTRFAVEVLIPETPPATYWVGGLGLLVDCPSAGLYDRWIGYHALQFLDEGEFNRLEFALSEDVVDVLAGEHDCTVAFELTANPAVGSFILDGGGFLPEQGP